MDVFMMIRYYVIMLIIFFTYMSTSNKTWYSNKFVFYSATVYIPFFIFTMFLLNSQS